MSLFEGKNSVVFEAIAKTIAKKDNNSLEAVASLQNLAGVFDENTINKIQENPDLLFIASNLLVLNEVNLNDCAVCAEDLIPIAHKFKNKFFNVEHDKQNICGAISDITYSLLGTNEIIEEDKAIELAQTQKIQLVVGGYLWRLVNKELCNLIEESSGYDDNKISTSFEFLFDGYWIGVDLQGDKNVLTSKIIKPNDPEFDRYKKMLRKNGGKGKTESGELVYMILKTGILPTGAGIVADPASGIKGILAVDPENLVEKEDEEDETEESESSNSDIKETDSPLEEDKNLLKEDKISVTPLTASNNVINLQQDTIMDIKIESLEDISSKWAELSKQESVASTIREYIETQYVKPALEFAEKMKAKEELIAQVESAKAESEQKLLNLEATIIELNKELAAVRAAQAALEEQERYNRWMNAFEDCFEFDDEESKTFLVDEVKSMKTDEAFAEWMNKQKKLHKEKTKAYKKDMMEKLAMEKMAMEKASTEVVKPSHVEVASTVKKEEPLIDVREVLASATETAGQSISTGPSVSESLREKMLNAFKASATVGGKKMK